MPYRYERDIALADIAFEAGGKSAEELFIAAADAVTNVMVDNLDDVEPRERRSIVASGNGYEALLFDFLQELIFIKDTGRLLLRIVSIRLWKEGVLLRLEAEAAGEEIDPGRHRLRVDVKAVTLHRFSVTRKNGDWVATVTLDI